MHDIVDDDGADTGDAPEDIPETISLTDAADVLTTSPCAEGVAHIIPESGAADTTQESSAAAEDAVPRDEDDALSGGDTTGRVSDAAGSVPSTSAS